MGATSRLVITPLTDRCWLTLTGSYGLKLSAPHLLAGRHWKDGEQQRSCRGNRYLLYRFQLLRPDRLPDDGQIIRGLAQAGCWTCLDEFNRIDIEVLSVIAQQLTVLRQGRLMKKDHLNFMGVEIVLKDHHVIVTMNPGYAGRQSCLIICKYASAQLR